MRTNYAALLLSWPPFRSHCLILRHRRKSPKELFLITESVLNSLKNTRFLLFLHGYVPRPTIVGQWVVACQANFCLTKHVVVHLPYHFQLSTNCRPKHIPTTKCQSFIPLHPCVCIDFLSKALLVHFSDSWICPDHMLPNQSDIDESTLEPVQCSMISLPWSLRLVTSPTCIFCCHYIKLKTQLTLSCYGLFIFFKTYISLLWFWFQQRVIK